MQYKLPAKLSTTRQGPLAIPARPKRVHVPVPVTNIRLRSCRALGICRPVLAIAKMEKICTGVCTDTYRRTKVGISPIDNPHKI